MTTKRIDSLLHRQKTRLVFDATFVVSMVVASVILVFLAF